MAKMGEQIQSVIAATAEVNSRNHLSTIQVRQWLSGYLEMHKEEVGRFPELTGKPHFDVTMADFDKSRPALFAVVVFNDKTVTFAAGKGESLHIRDFLERKAPLDANQIIPELAARFFVSDVKVTCSRQDVLDWLG